MKTRALALTLLTMTGAPMGASERVGLNVSPSMAFAPADLSVRATVESSDDNRMIGIVAESADFYRSSQIQLDGVNAPRTTSVSFRGLPSGLYSVRVVVRGARGQTLGYSERSASILGRDGAR